MKFQKGFTLIELLVVVAIISLLSSVVLASLRDARDRAKLTAFQQDVEQFILAAELYKTDHGGELPAVVYFGSSVDNPDPGADFTNNFGQYISKFPVPPFPLPNDESLYYVGETLPALCGGVETYHYLVLNYNYSVSTAYDPLEEWGWTFSNNGLGLPCIPL